MDDAALVALLCQGDQAGMEELAEHLRQIARSGDLILTVGAGDIYTVGEELTGPEI